MTGDTDNDKTTQRTVGKSKPVQVLTLEVSSAGILTQCPVYEKHRRGKNWLAEIELDPSTGGLLRSFWVSSRYGGYYVVPENLPNRLPVSIEIAGDYFTSSGKRQYNRFYGVITGVQTNNNRITALIVEEYKTALEAIERARELETQQVAQALSIPPHQIGTIREELHKLLQVCRLLPMKNTAVTQLCSNLEGALHALDEIQSDAGLRKKET